MNAFFAVFKKEIKAYVDHPLAYILAVVFLAINNFMFFRAAYLEGVLSLRAMFSFLPWMLLFFIPALTMRSWAEERKEQTLALLLSYPSQAWSLVAGKFAASLAFMTGLLLLTIPVPLALSVAGDLDGGVVFAQYLGAFFAAAAMVAVGQWASTLSKNQVVSFIIALAVLFGFFLVSLDAVLLALPYPLNIIGQQLGMLSHVQSLSRGLVDMRDVLYFISIVVVFGALTIAWLYRFKLAPSDPVWKKMKSSVAVILAIAVVVNLFGQSLTLRVDATEGNIYSLSPATKRVLSELDDTVRFTLYRSKKLPTQVELVSRDIEDMLNDYKKFGGHFVDVVVRYPDADEEAAQDARDAGIPTIRFNVVRQDEFTVQEGYLGLSVQFLDKRETVPFVQSTSDLEYRLSRALLVLRNDKKPKLGYVSDFGGIELNSAAAFSEALRENYLVEVVRLSSAEEGESVDQIDESIDVLMIAAPTQTYSEAATEEIRRFIARGGKIFWLLPGVNVDQASLSVRPVKTGLENLLAEYGIRVQNDIVADARAHETVNFSTGVFTYFYPYPYWVRAAASRHVLAGNVSQVVLTWPSSIELEQGNDALRPLIETTPDGARFTSNYQLSPDRLPDFGAVEKKSYVLAAAHEQVPADEGAPAGRWVVAANAGLIDDGLARQYSQNVVFALNAIDWLSQNDALVGIRSKQSQPVAMVWPSPAAQTAAKWGNIAGVPVAVVLFGSAWLYRRRRYILSSN